MAALISEFLISAKRPDEDTSSQTHTRRQLVVLNVSPTQLVYTLFADSTISKCLPKASPAGNGGTRAPIDFNGASFLGIGGNSSTLVFHFVLFLQWFQWVYNCGGHRRSISWDFLICRSQNPYVSCSPRIGLSYSRYEKVIVIKLMYTTHMMCFNSL